MMKSLCVVFPLALLSACLAWIGCTPSESAGTALADPPSGNLAAEDTLTIFMTGNILGTLQPCGCSSGQLGGLDRRGAVLATAPADRRLVLDTGNLLAGNPDAPGQDMIKLGILLHAMEMLHYDAANVTAEDLAAVRNVGMIDGTAFKLITAVGNAEPGLKPVYTKQFDLHGGTLKVTLASAASDSLDLTSIRSLFDRHAPLSLNILILDEYSDDAIESLQALDELDVVVCPTAADEPRVLRQNRRGPLFVSVGRLGKYVARLRAKPAKAGKLTLQFDKIAVDETLPRDESLAALYKDYQAMLKEDRLLENYHRVPLPNGLKYMGTESCRSCHDSEHDKWSPSLHAHAYQKLVEVGSQYDPECVKCHVVGFGYESGFISEASPPDLRDVGCEVCHGPGSDHLKALASGRLDKGIAQPQAKCIDCHTPDHSPAYQGHEDEFLQKIVHWREPDARGDVK